MGAGAGGADGRRRRLHRRRHGRHELRHLPRARRPARDQDRLELAVPLLHRPADGRRAERRRRRRLDRPRAPGRAARRSRVGRLGARARSATAAAATAPTVTDADAVLGYLPVDGFAGGRMTLDVDAARAADRSATSPSRSASTSSRRRGASSASSTPTWPTRPVACSASHGADPRELALIAYGGNGAVHAWAIATELGVDRILVPKAAPAFSALGRARRRLRRRSRCARTSTPLVAGRPRRASARSMAELRDEAAQGARADRARRRRRSTRACSRRCATRARTST